MIRPVFLLLALAGFASPLFAQVPTTYVAGETDIQTPGVRLLAVRAFRWQETATVTVRVSEDFEFCPDCVASLPEGYGQLPQVPNEGHVHVYFRRLGRIGEERQADVFCPFNVFNGTTREVVPGVWRSQCEKPERGWYRVCAVAETNAHTQRIKAHPRDFPPVDCKKVRIR